MLVAHLRAHAPRQLSFRVRERALGFSELRSWTRCKSGYDRRVTQPVSFGPAITLEGMWEPVLTVRFHGAASDDDFAAYLSEMERMMYKRTDRLAMILDARRASLAPATQRTMQASWLKTHEAAIRARSVGMSFIFSNAIIRGTMTAVFWLQRPPVPHHVAATELEARAWCTSQLEADGRGHAAG
jgi:hypothetical protein